MEENRDQNWVQTKVKIKQQREKLMSEFKNLKRKRQTFKRRSDMVGPKNEIIRNLKTVENVRISQEGMNNGNSNQDPEISSVKNHHAHAGSLNSQSRLSKLSEEEASSIFAQRRKELLGKLTQQRQNHKNKKHRRKPRKKIGPTLKKKLIATNGDIPSPERRKLQPNFVIFSGQCGNNWQKKKLEEIKDKKQDTQQQPYKPPNRPKIKLIKVLSPQEHFQQHEFTKRTEKIKIVSSSVLDLPEPTSFDLVPQQQEQNPSRHHSDCGIIYLLEEKRSNDMQLDSLKYLEVKQPLEIDTQQVDLVIINNKRIQAQTKRLIKKTQQKREKLKQNFFNLRNRTEPNITNINLRYTKRQNDIIKSRRSPNPKENSYFRQKEKNSQGKHLFDQAKVYEEHRQKLTEQQNKRKISDIKEKCTFRPQINEVFKKQKKLWQRAKKIDQEKKNRRTKRQKQNLKAQLKNCTFSPKLNKKSQKLASLLDNNFYIRSMKWKKKKLLENEEIRQKQLQKFTSEKTPKSKRKRRKSRKNSVFSAQFYIESYNRRSNSSSNVVEHNLGFDKRILEQIQRKKRFLEREKQNLEREITQRHRNPSKSKSRSRSKPR